MSRIAALMIAAAQVGCSAPRAPDRTGPANSARQLQPTDAAQRTEFLGQLFAAVASHDAAALDALGDPEREWLSTLECPPRSADFAADRSRFQWVVDQTKDVRLDLAGVGEDTVLLDIAQGHDDGFGCRAKVPMRFHRLVLRVTATAASGDMRHGTWTVQAVEHDGAWHLTADVTRLHI